MKAWKPLALIVPAGLLLGMAAGAANRPVMVDRAKDYWPASVVEAKSRIERARSFYEGGPQDLTPVSYSYRPNLDYSAYAWPDQREPSFAAEPEMSAGEEMSQQRTAQETVAVQRAGDRAEAAAEDAMAAAAEATPTEAQPAESTVPTPVPAIETASF